MAADLGELWQKNKSLGVFLGGGLALLLIAETAIGYLYRDDLDTAQNQIRSEAKELQKKRANKANQETVEAMYQKLQKGIADVEGRAQFEESADYQLKDGGASPENQYFDIVTKTREKLVSRALHNNIEVPEGLGLPPVSPTGKEEIRRFLRGLDLVQRAIRIAIDSEVTSINDIRIEPELRAKKREGADASKPGPSMDQVRVRMKLTGSGLSLTSFLESTQMGKQPLLLERAKISTSPKGELLVGEFEFLALRFFGSEESKKNP